MIEINGRSRLRFIEGMAKMRGMHKLRFGTLLMTRNLLGSWFES